MAEKNAQNDEGSGKDSKEKIDAGESDPGEKKITKDMTIGDAIENYPETAEVMFRHGLHCVGCHVAGCESIEEGAAGHGIDADKLVEEMNKAVEKKSKEKE